MSNREATEQLATWHELVKQFPCLTYRHKRNWIGRGAYGIPREELGPRVPGRGEAALFQVSAWARAIEKAKILPFKSGSRVYHDHQGTWLPLKEICSPYCAATLFRWAVKGKLQAGRVGAIMFVLKEDHDRLAERGDWVFKARANKWEPCGPVRPACDYPRFTQGKKIWVARSIFEKEQGHSKAILRRNEHLIHSKMVWVYIDGEPKRRRYDNEADINAILDPRLIPGAERTGRSLAEIENLSDGEYLTEQEVNALGFWVEDLLRYTKRAGSRRRNCKPHPKTGRFIKTRKAAHLEAKGIRMRPAVTWRLGDLRAILRADGKIESPVLDQSPDLLQPHAALLNDIHRNTLAVPAIHDCLKEHREKTEPRIVDPKDDPRMWRNTRWIKANSQVTSDDIRTARHAGKVIDTRTPDDAKHPEYFLPHIEQHFPAKAAGLVARVKQN